MILGTGIDITSVARIKNAIAKHGEPFCERILTQNEINLFKQNKASWPNYVAKKFTAKEAIAKAIGCGIGQLLSFADIETYNNELGAPFVKINQQIINAISKTKKIRATAQTIAIHVSISDEKTSALAFAILELLFHKK